MKPGPKPMTDDERFEHILSRLDVGDCWLWTGAASKAGYGNVWTGTGWTAVHRYVWEHLIGPLDGKHLDHRCRVTLCCNPLHLALTTPRDNNHRGEAPNYRAHRTDTCKRGHDLTDAWVDRNGTRKCRACRALLARERRAGLR